MQVSPRWSFVLVGGIGKIAVIERKRVISDIDNLNPLPIKIL